MNDSSPDVGSSSGSAHDEHDEHDEEAYDIRCEVTMWFHKRMAMMSLMFVAMGLYFVYDGSIGYPKKNKVVDEYDRFNEEILGSYQQFVDAGDLEGWNKKAQEMNWPTGEEGKAPLWKNYAAERGWEEGDKQKGPKRYSEKEIREQFYWGGGCLAVGLVILVYWLGHLGKKLLGKEDGFRTHKGQEVAFEDVFKLDTRKWEHKGLAYAYLREGGEGKVLKVALDDLKFEGAQKVLDRLMENFEGELVEKVAHEEDDDEEGDELSEQEGVEADASESEQSDQSGAKEE